MITLNINILYVTLITQGYCGGGGGVMITLNMNILNVTLITQGYWGGGGGKDIIEHVYFECNTDYTRSLGEGGG